MLGAGTNTVGKITEICTSINLVSFLAHKFLGGKMSKVGSLNGSSFFSRFHGID